MDHSDDEQLLERLAADVSITDARWNRRWRLGQALMPRPAPTWTAIALSAALLLCAAVLVVVVGVSCGQRWLLLVVGVFAVGMQPVVRSTRRRPSHPVRVSPDGRTRPRCRARDRSGERPR